MGAKKVRSCAASIGDPPEIAERDHALARALFRKNAARVDARVLIEKR